MTLTIGRISLDEFTAVTRSGRGLALSGSLIRNDDAAAIGKQFRGLEEAASPPYLDEPIVPVTWDVDPTFDGFYRVGTVQWDQSADQKQLYDDLVVWSIGLERVGGNPSVESKLTGAVRSNDHSITDTNVVGFHAFPTSGSPSVPAQSYRNGLYEYVEAIDTVGSGGGVQVWAPSVAEFSGTASWMPVVGSFYDGAATVEDEDENFMLGRTGTPAAISNGIIRVSFVDTGITVESGEGASDWAATSYTFGLEAGGVGWDVYPSSAVVLMNRPEVVGMRAMINGPGGPGTMDVILRRGERMARVTAQWDLDDLAVDITHEDVGWTFVTGGRRRQTADADGNVWVMSTPLDFTGGSEPAIEVTGATKVAPFGVGIIQSASSPAALTAIYRYMAAQHERQMVVQR